jgi:hypothetical protein
VHCRCKCDAAFGRRSTASDCLALMIVAKAPVAITVTTSAVRLYALDIE